MVSSQPNMGVSMIVAIAPTAVNLLEMILAVIMQALLSRGLAKLEIKALHKLKAQLNYKQI